MKRRLPSFSSASAWSAVRFVPLPAGAAAPDVGALANAAAAALIPPIITRRVISAISVSSSSSSN
jgi:hypothetical protein